MPCVPGVAKLVVGLGLVAATFAADAPGSIVFSESCKAQCPSSNIASLARELQTAQAPAMDGVLTQAGAGQSLSDSIKNMGPLVEKVMVGTFEALCKHESAFECVVLNRDVCVPDLGSADHAGASLPSGLDMETRSVRCMCQGCAASLLPGMAKFHASLVQKLSTTFSDNVSEEAKKAATTALLAGTCGLYEGLKCAKTISACAGMDPFEGHQGLAIGGTSLAAFATSPALLKAMCDAKGVSTELNVTEFHVEPRSTSPGPGPAMDHAIRMGGWPCLALLGAVPLALW